MVAKHVDVDECVAMAVDSLSRGHPLTSIGCSKCGATNLDTGDFARRLHRRHLC